VVWVPGAFELPVAAEAAAASGRYSAIVALGCVIRGETPHFEYVAGEAARGLGTVALAHRLAVGFGVLTTESLEQAMARAGGAAGNKCYEAAEAALATADVLAQLTSAVPRDLGARPRAAAPLCLGAVRAPVHRERGDAPGVDLRAPAPGLRSRRRSRRPGHRRSARVRPARRRGGRALAAGAGGHGRAEHPAPRPRGARRRRDAAARRDRRGGEARSLVRGAEGPGVRERGAGRGGAGARCAVKLLLVNWNDRANPHAGG